MKWVSGRVNVHVSSCMDLAESFKTPVPRRAHADGEEQGCRAVLQGATAISPAGLENELNTWTEQKLSEVKKLNITSNPSLKSSYWRKVFCKERDPTFYLPLESPAFPLCFSSLHHGRIQYIQISTRLRPLNTLFTETTDLVQDRGVKANSQGQHINMYK